MAALFRAKKLNVNGGAIAIGHPLAATGIRLAITLSRELAARSSAMASRRPASAAGRELHCWLKIRID
jgi:acetyl-CoA acetyltransferase